MTQATLFKVYVVKNGIRDSLLSWEESHAPSIIVDADAEICSSFAGEFIASDAFDPLRDELNPAIVIDGVEQSLGFFPITTAETKRSSDGVTKISVEGYDRCWRAKAAKLESMLYLPAGRRYIQIINELLAQAGIVKTVVVPSDALLMSDREEWSVGTSLLDIINTLLDEMGYRHLWADADGFVHVEPYRSLSSRSIDHYYSGRSRRYAPMGAEVTVSQDIWDAPNVFICICDNPDNAAGALTATAVNDSLNSSKSTARRNLRIPAVYNVDQIADLDALQAYANKLRDDSLKSSVTVSFESPVEAGHGVGDIIAIDNSAIAGIYVEKSFRIRMSAGTQMQHSAVRTVFYD